MVTAIGWRLHRHHRGPQFLIDTTNTEWILLSGHQWIPLLGHQRILFHGHGQTLLVSETDPAERADLEAKLQTLLKLPEDVLLQVLQHPDLADFNKMLDAVFLGDIELWWIESQLDKFTLCRSRRRSLASTSVASPRSCSIRPPLPAQTAIGSRQPS
jgi:hypothetical protein